MTNPTIVLKKFNLSDSEIQLYLTLVKHEALTAQELVKLTKAKRPTVYYALRQLQERGLVHKSGSLGVERFQAETPEKLLTLLTLRHRELEELAEEVREIIPSIKKGREVHDGIPAVSFYEGDSAIKQAIMDTIYCRDRHIDSLAPKDNFFWEIGQAFSASYVRARVDRGITTRNLWEEPLPKALLDQSYRSVSDIRILPPPMHGRFRTAIFLFDDKVLYIASRKSGYALLVRSKEHHEMMRAIYDTLWEISKSVKVG